MIIPAAEIRNAPALDGNPSAAATTAPGATRFGPKTAPMVMAHTTNDRSRPRRSGCARSVTAKRACRFTAFATPTPKQPSTRTGNEWTITAQTISTVPTIAPHSPLASAIRRPARKARRDSGTAVQAVPRVMAVLLMPAQTSAPANCTARIDPSVSVEPALNPEKTCAAASVRTVLR
ncbi:hypothetical protein SDC9_160155 [bioreactor metagenome]|uniref:Uncharacterized protein n=1 Tax=bioreactor metagenome TaxID=1076179 RepID=A0A645FEL5_9ZZZZ